MGLNSPLGFGKPTAAPPTSLANLVRSTPCGPPKKPSPRGLPRSTWRGQGEGELISRQAYKKIWQAPPPSNEWLRSRIEDCSILSIDSPPSWGTASAARTPTPCHSCQQKVQKVRIDTCERIEIPALLFTPDGTKACQSHLLNILLRQNFWDGKMFWLWHNETSRFLKLIYITTDNTKRVS
jgi:hypothetical protein